MFSSLLLSFREGLEAALVVAIILAYLHQSGKKASVKFVYYGVLIGVAVSLFGGFIGFREAQELGEKSEELFEGIMMLVASGLIIYFIVWMGNQSNNISADIKNKVKSSSNAVGLLVLSFLSVFREGVELCIFTFTKISEKAPNVALGSGIGIVLAIILTYIIFKTSIKFNLKLIFKGLGLILIYLGADMFAEGILKFIPMEEEPFEAILMALFVIPSLYFFMKSDIQKLLKRA
ncbi:FTR1 family protein [Bacillota bacterium LX-D]|nr:FTR1 family protein [Bacillota bacterium LX-D]